MIDKVLLISPPYMQLSRPEFPVPNSLLRGIKYMNPGLLISSSILDEYNISNQIIKSIKLSVPYTGGNKNYTVQCILSVDGKQISTQDLVFKTRGNETLTLNFTNVNIPIKSKITFTFDSSKTSSQGNQAVIIKSMEVDATF